MIAPDDTTFEYLAGREFAPQGAAWDEAVARWRTLPTDDGAAFDKSVTLDATALEPMITYGTNPGMGMPITEPRSRPGQLSDASAEGGAREGARLHGLRAGPAAARPPGRRGLHRQLHQLAHLRPAAGGARPEGPQGRAEACACWSCPARRQVKKQAEAEGLDRIFKDAGAEWREAGCSMCIAMNGDQLEPGQYAVSTSNRNFEGRQGKGGRTFLASPADRGGDRRHRQDHRRADLLSG